MSNDLNAKLQQHLEQVGTKLDALLLKFNQSAESMLGKSLEKTATAEPTEDSRGSPMMGDLAGKIALAKRNEALQLEVDELRRLVLELFQWSNNPQPLAAENLAVWTKVVQLVARWKNESTQQGASNAG